MVSVYDVNGCALVTALSKTLKENKDLKTPEWAKFVKTGAQAYRPPQDKDWWYARLASLLRTLYIQNTVGVRRVKNKFGARRKVGCRHKKHVKAGGKIIRVGFQMLEKQGFVSMVPKKGRVLTPKGRALLDKTAALMVKKV